MVEARKISATLFTWLWAVCLLGVSSAGASTLNYGDGKADGRKSLGGSGEMIKFTLPSGQEEVTGIKIHGSRYGYPKAPDEHFLIFFLNDDMSEIVNTQMAPYRLFKRGKNEWVEVRFPKAVKVPTVFWVALDFRAHRTKGVYVSYDTGTKGEHSRVGLPGQKARETDFSGDWMIQVVVSE